MSNVASGAPFFCRRCGGFFVVVVQRVSHLPSFCATVFFY
jgi:hypothetical protein